MYDFICGKIDRIRENTAVIDNNGMGYSVFCPVNDLAEISSKIGSEVKIFVHFIHREDTAALYGFLTEESRDGFRTLIKVDGVGPRTALTMLSKFSINTIRESVQNENIAELKKIPGIGDKTARKMILDLKGTVSFMQSGNFDTYDNDLLSAMVSMGYAKNDVLKVFDKSRPFSGNFSDDIKKLLKMMV